MAKSSYNCSEQELYTICETGWTSCRQYLDRFNKFKAKYKDPLVDDRQAAIKKARELPDEQQRNEKYESANVQLKKAGRIACDKWQPQTLHCRCLRRRPAQIKMGSCRIQLL